MRSNLFYVFLSFLCRSGFATNLHVMLSDSDAGFFLKPEPVGGNEDTDQGQQHDHVIVPVMHPLLLTSIRAEYGEFIASETVPRSLLRRALGSERLHPSTIIEDMEISAHVVMQTISTDRPLLQVLFHGNVLPAFRVDARRRLSETLEPGRNLSSGQGTTANYRTETKYCLTAHVEKDFNVLSAFCVLNGRTSVCLAEIGIPHWWWNADQTEYAQVFYSASVLDQNSNCLDVQNRNRSNSDSSSSEERNFISTVTLTLGQLTYEELKEDQNILVYIPQASFYPGSKFRVPVKLQAESDLQIFVMKVKARHGVRVIGAEARNSSEWKITLDLNHKLHGAMVTAFVADKRTAKKNDRITDIYEWIFEVNEEVSGDDRGRINLVVEYEMNVHQKEMYRSVENRIVARVEIQRDNVFAIVPVIKTSELVNTAVLTGKMLTYPMRIYSVTHTGRLNEVTPQATCHSGDEDALKVVESCSWVYLDGTEARGSSSVTVITKYGRHTKFLFFQVWMPEIPLEVTLSDPQLSQIKGWKVPNQPTGSSRKARGADFGILTHPGLLLQEEGIRKEDLVASCDVRYQSAVVEVYTSFALADTPHNRFLAGRKAMFRVTDLVQSQLRLANTSVAVLDGNIIEGLQPGRTEVQVLSKSGAVIGASELIVATDKVGIEGLQVDIVAKLSLSIDVLPDMPRALVARVKKTSLLQHRYREAFLDISIKFDDGTVLTLQNVPHGDYHLDLDSLNNHVVAIGQSFNPDVPKVIALGRGKGELLKVSLMLNEACQRKKSRLLAFSHVYIEVDFSQPATENERVQNDAAQFSYEGNRRRTSIQKSGKDTLHVSLNNEGDQPKTRASDGQAADSGARGSGRDGQATLKEVQSKHIGDEHNLSSLEVGMYTLLGVFCVALVVFGINCGLFLTRYRHKKSQHDAKDPINCAPDWVWIGRDTLERNAINTACSQALMPEADFNGNHSGQTESSSGPLTTTNPGSNRNSSSASAVSNRNSFVSSTHKGAECGAQIATNMAPLPDCNANILDDNDADGNCAKDATERASPEALVISLKKAHHEHNAKKELMSQSSENHDTSSIDSSHHPAPVRGKMTREERFRQLEEAVASGSDVEWEYEALGVTYEELMEYFDNLKESTA